MQQGGVSVNDAKVTDVNAQFCCQDCGADGAIIKKGKKVFHCVKIAE